MNWFWILVIVTTCSTLTYKFQTEKIIDRWYPDKSCPKRGTWTGRYLDSGMSISIVETKPPSWGMLYTCFGRGTKMGGGLRVLVIFQDRPRFSLIIQKVAARVFQ